MLKTRLILLLFVFTYTITLAQEAKVKIMIANTNAKTAVLIQNREISNPDPLKETTYTFSLTKEQASTQVVKLKKSQFLLFNCYDAEKKKNLNYWFFLSPGDDLVFIADFNVPDFNIKVTGIGNSNNQPLLGSELIFKAYLFNRDTVPTRFIAALNQQQKQLESNFAQYVTAHQPSAAFIEDWKGKLKYYSSNAYYNFKTGNQFLIRDAYDRNFDAWQKAQDSLFILKDLNNDEALEIREYAALVRMVLIREKERLWIEKSKNPEKFYREWYDADTVTGKKLYQEDVENVLREKIINKNFKGKTAEYLYTIVLEDAIKMFLIKNTALVFEHFKQKYPDSRYVMAFKPQIDEVVKKQTQKIAPTMVFAKDNGKKLNSFEEILQLSKGKTVLLDMWGTWCGPCRQEMANNGKEVKAYFKDKGLDYLYIANNDFENEEKWKELIAYFKLDGTHILANKQLTKDITEKIKSNVFPTYVIIKKDGTFEVCKVGFPMDRAILLKQVDEALALGN